MCTLMSTKYGRLNEELQLFVRHRWHPFDNRMSRLASVREHTMFLLCIKREDVGCMSE